jgi:hypothetical protein
MIPPSPTLQTLPVKSCFSSCHISPSFMFLILLNLLLYRSFLRGGHHRMVVRFTTTCSISCEFEPRPDEVYSIQHYVIKFATGLCFSPGTPVSTERHDITEILLKVVLNTINLPTRIFLEYLTLRNYQPIIRLCFTMVNLHVSQCLP